jgi:hypothetical protein
LVEEEKLLAFRVAATRFADIRRAILKEIYGTRKRRDYAKEDVDGGR